MLGHPKVNCYASSWNQPVVWPCQECRWCFDAFGCLLLLLCSLFPLFVLGTHVARLLLRKQMPTLLHPREVGQSRPNKRPAPARLAIAMSINGMGACDLTPPRSLRASGGDRGRKSPRGDQNKQGRGALIGCTTRWEQPLIPGTRAKPKYGGGYLFPSGGESVVREMAYSCTNAVIQIRSR